jgi:lipopolysaccharide/colanic/teichoic acid biosynthesis glycosyltransferase
MDSSATVLTSYRLARTPRIKRAFDILVSATALTLLTPLLLGLMVLIRLDSRGPAIFRQHRVGKNGREFTLFKFRTMVRDAEARLESLQELNVGGKQLIRIHNDPRVTRIGHFLRPTGIDELPQLINVLRGEMSLIGPRPQSPSEVELYTERERRRLEVLPGISGLWQVEDRSEDSFDAWVRQDLKYIDEWSLLLDLKITLKTLAILLHFKR